ncbi:FAD-dependent monooxygenase [bacterium]|nr:FAD-dependent monooxygenase [bacterium]
MVVGCGPAGVAAAKILKKNNINYCMIDKKHFTENYPRENF